MKNHERLFPLILLIVTSIFLVIFYGDLFYKPNSHLFNVSGDAIKNYYTYAAHSKGADFIHFNQMNYPYGESFFYLDCHPLLTMIIKTVATVFPVINNYTIGIINFLMLFSIALTALFSYLILVKFKVDKLFALISAFAISILAPQLLRLSGHFALSYSFAIPFSWYLFIKFKESNKKLKWSIILMINSMAWFMIHGYLGMIIVSFILLSSLFNLLSGRKQYSNRAEWIYLIIQTLIPMIIFWLLIKLTDTHEGRNDQPYGILTYIANYQSIFLPSYPPLRNFYGTYFNIETNWEGWAYVGIGSVIFIVIFITNTLFKIFRIHIINDTGFIRNKVLIPSLIASIVLLLLSMGYPFKLKMEYLLDWFPVINNFRGIGRFSWPFFYTITISAIVYASQLLKPNKYRVIVYLLVTLIPLSYIWEGLPHHKSVRKNMSNTQNLFNKKYLPPSFSQALLFADSSKYQAIIPLPFYHIGSEDFKAIGTVKSRISSMVVSYHSGLPIMGNYSTNTSIIESKNLIQILSPNCYDKEVLKSISSKKPFLIIYTNEELKKYESDLAQRGEKIFSCGDFSLYSISYEKFLLNDSKNRIADFQSIKDQLYEKNDFLLSTNDTSTFLFYDSFENGNSETVHDGKHSLKGELKKYTQVANVNPNKLIEGREYMVSFWMYNLGEKSGQGVLTSNAFVQTKDKNGKVNWISVTNPARSVVIDGAWSLVELTFKMPPDAKEVSVFVKGDDKSDKVIYIDDLLIREKGVDVYKIMQEKNGSITELFANNNKIAI